MPKSKKWGCECFPLDQSSVSKRRIVSAMLISQVLLTLRVFSELGPFVRFLVVIASNLAPLDVLLSMTDLQGER